MKQKWEAGILRGHSGSCPHRIARTYTKIMPPLVQPSNPYVPHLTHAVTLAVNLHQLHVMFIDLYQWLPSIAASAHGARIRELDYFRHGHMIESVMWMWHKCRSGIAVCIRKGKLALFVPFCNIDYTNTLSAAALSLLPNEGIPGKNWWANGWTMCGDRVSPQGWGDQGICALQNMIMVCCEKGVMGDCDFIINKRDTACVRRDCCDPMNPIDTYQRPERRPGLVPVLSLYVGDQFADIAMPLPSDWHRLSGGAFEAQNPLPPVLLPKRTKWSCKLDCAVFRGGLTGTGGHAGTNQRIALLHMRSDGNFDFKGTSRSGRYRFCPLDHCVVQPHARGLDVGPHNRVPLHVQQERFRYIVTVDGHSGADRVAALMGGNQCVLKVDAPWHALSPDTWATQRLHAWEHYVPVSRALTDLSTRLAWLRQNKDAGRRMRENCARWASRERDAVIAWWLKMTNAMSRAHAD